MSLWSLGLLFILLALEFCWADIQCYEKCTCIEEPFLTINCSGQGFEFIPLDELQEFQFIDLNHNELTQLMIPEWMPNLIRLDVAYNKINETLIYKPENFSFYNLNDEMENTSLCPLINTNLNLTDIEECDNLLIIDLTGNFISEIPETDQHACYIQNDLCVDEILTEKNTESINAFTMTSDLNESLTTELYIEYSTILTEIDLTTESEITTKIFEKEISTETTTKIFEEEISTDTTKTLIISDEEISTESTTTNQLITNKPNSTEEILTASVIVMNQNITTPQVSQGMRFVIGFSISLVVIVLLSIIICVYILCHGKKLSNIRVNERLVDRKNINLRNGTSYIKVETHEKDFYN